MKHLASLNETCRAYLSLQKSSAILDFLTHIKSNIHQTWLLPYLDEAKQDVCF